MGGNAVIVIVLVGVYVLLAFGATQLQQRALQNVLLNHVAVTVVDGMLGFIPSLVLGVGINLDHKVDRNLILVHHLPFLVSSGLPNCGL
jgi:hypothetical protein